MIIQGKIKVSNDGDIMGCEDGCGEVDDTCDGERILNLVIEVPDNFFDPVEVNITVVEKSTIDGTAETVDTVSTEEEQKKNRSWFGS